MNQNFGRLIKKKQAILKQNNGNKKIFSSTASYAVRKEVSKS